MKLNTIDIIMEQFNLDPISGFDGIETFSEEAGYQYISDAYAEASIGVNIGNAFQKIWTFILKCFKWLFGWVPKLINWTRSLFQNRNLKTADQIMSEVLSSSPENGSPDPNDTNNNSDADKASAGTSKKVPVKIPASPKSDKNSIPPSANAIFKDLNLKFESDKKAVTITIGDLDNRLYYSRKINQHLEVHKAK